MTFGVILLVDIAQSGKIYALRRASRLSANSSIARRRGRRGALSRKDKSEAFLDHRCEGAIVGRRLLARAAKEIFGKADRGAFSHVKDI